ncbi:MAG TPA: aldo/keto reductase [Jatrophihabitans sp.]|nr:aldo/keto reductase [Jatrophihabitans sp.]
MRHVRLGGTGLQVSRLCLGTATFGAQCDEETSRAILDRAFDAGVTFVDTADKYPLGGTLATNGRSEEILGRWLRGRRDECVVATKFHGAMGTAAWDQGTSRKHILDAIDGSLRRLGVEYIDLYQFHRPDPLTPIEESLSTLDDLVRAGKVRYIGVSNFLAYQTALALGCSDRHGFARIVSVQPCYNLVFRQWEHELFRLAQEQQLAVLPYNPLAGGLLTGKHAGRAPNPGTRYTLENASHIYTDKYWNEPILSAVEEIGSIAREAGIAPATLAVGWVLANPVVTSAIIGATRPEQLTDTLAAAEVELSRDLVDRLTELTHQFRRGDELE